MTSAADLKAAGNAAFKSKKYDDAMTQYGNAISAAASGDDSALLSTCHLNRAMAALKLAETSAERKRELLESALIDAKKGGEHDATNVKAPFREALACVQLGDRKEAALDALHRAWRLAPGDAEVRRLLVAQDSVFARFEVELERLGKSAEEKRLSLHQMVSRSHPMNMRNAYYKTWMVVWTPEDRECALANAFMKVLEAFDARLKEEAKGIAIDDKEKGEVCVVLPVCI